MEMSKVHHYDYKYMFTEQPCIMSYLHFAMYQTRQISTLNQRHPEMYLNSHIEDMYIQIYKPHWQALNNLYSKVICNEYFTTTQNIIMIFEITN